MPTETNFAQQNAENQDNTLGVVYSVILDSTHPKYKDAGDIGGITYRIVSPTDTTATLTPPQLPVAYPFDKNFTNLPLINEKVSIFRDGSNITYKRIDSDVSGNKNLSSAYNTISQKFAKKQQSANTQQISEQNKAEHYGKVQANNIPRSTSEGESSTNTDGYGAYFVPSNIHKLTLNEGDTLIESRFGQSIRFSAYNNPNRVFSPNIIIRNSESPLTQIVPAASGSINEDINRDGSCIVLSSGDYILPFIPGTINQKGATDFQTQPKSFKPYPEKLKGDQVLINSGRIILSAKSAEMMFYAKGNVGFISDGQFSIDTRLGMNVSVNDNISFVTNDRDFQIFSGNGSVFLGSKDLEPMVKGQKLVEILSELIQAIGDMQFLTPSGPSAIGPKNKPDFGKIHSKLNDILSKLNQTA